jgi:hypothetical protein
MSIFNDDDTGHSLAIDYVTELVGKLERSIQAAEDALQPTSTVSDDHENTVSPSSTPSTSVSIDLARLSLSRTTEDDAALEEFKRLNEEELKAKFREDVQLQTNAITNMSVGQLAFLVDPVTPNDLVFIYRETQSSTKKWVTSLSNFLWDGTWLRDTKAFEIPVTHTENFQYPFRTDLKAIAIYTLKDAEPTEGDALKLADPKQHEMRKKTIVDRTVSDSCDDVMDKMLNKNAAVMTGFLTTLQTRLAKKGLTLGRALTKTVNSLDRIYNKSEHVENFKAVYELTGDKRQELKTLSKEKSRRNRS